MRVNLKEKGRKLATLVLAVLMVLGSSMPGAQAFAESAARGLDISYTDLDLSKLDMYEFKCTQENMEIVKKGPNTFVETVQANGHWTKSTVFLTKFTKSSGGETINEPLELLFRNAGDFNGVKVNVRVKVKSIITRRTDNTQIPHLYDTNSGIPFLTVDKNWGSSGIQIMDYIYPDHPNVNTAVMGAYGITVPVTAGLEYADGSPCEAKLTMVPSDIDVLPNAGLPHNIPGVSKFHEEFGINNLNNKIAKITYNNKRNIDEYDDAAGSHWWKAKVGSDNPYDEHNITGFALRSISNEVDFAYTSAGTSGGLFRFFAEVPFKENPEKTAKKTVNKEELPKSVGEAIDYTVTYTVPRPGVDIIDDIKSLKFTDLFDKKLDFKDAIVKLDGRTLTKGQDYELVSKPDHSNGQDYTEINITNKELYGRDKAGKAYEITYKTETNKNALVKGDDKVINSTARMYFDNVPVFANTVESKLIPPNNPPTQPKKEVFTGNTAINIDGNLVKGDQELTYKVSYKNTTGKAEDVEITDKIPAYTRYVAGSANNNGVENAGTITWKKKALEDGETFSVLFKVKVDKDVNGKPVDNQAKVNTGENKFDTNKTHNPTPTEPKKEIFTGSSTTNIDGNKVEPGQELTYAITYKNTTGEDVKATITDKIPAHTKFVSAENGGTEAGGVVTWKADVAKDKSITVKFKVKVYGDVNGAPVDNKAKVNDGKNDYDTNETHNPTPTKPKKEVFRGDTTTNIDGKKVEPGETLTYAITYKNTTGKDVTATITDKIPAHTTFVSADNDGKEAGGIVTWKKAVEKGKSLTVTFNVKVNKTVNGEPVDNKAKVNDSTNDYDTNETHNPTPSKPVKEVLEFQSTTKIDGKRVEPGQKITYSIKYVNTTGKEADVTITDKIPAHTKFVSADNDGKEAGGVVTWKKKVAKGDSFVVKFTVEVDKDVNGNVVTNKAKANDGENDYDTNEVTNPTPTKPEKEVFKGSTTTKIDGKVVKGGDELTYAITYKNTTGEDVKATITDKIPAHTKFVSADNGGTEKDGVVTWEADVAKDKSITVKFTVKVDEDVNGQPIDNIAKVNDGKNDYDTNKTHNPTPTKPKKEVFTGGTTTNIDGVRVKPGQKLTYAITYKNTTGEERDVTITDKLPAHTTFVSADNGGKYAKGKVTWMKKVAKGETFKVTFTVKVDKDVNGQTLTNTARVNDGVNDSDTNTVKNPTPKVPKKPNNPDNPHGPSTGDNSNIMFMLMLLLASGGALGSAAYMRRKRQ